MRSALPNDSTRTSVGMIAGPISYRRRPLSASAVARSWKSDYVKSTTEAPAGPLLIRSDACWASALDT